QLATCTRRADFGGLQFTEALTECDLLVVGDREMANDQLAVRTQSGEDLGVMSVDDFITHVAEDVSALR
ncbi:MAG: hypothetical protein AAGL66_09180, partial [Pseudomonadota bacterium]